MIQCQKKLEKAKKIAAGVGVLAKGRLNLFTATFMAGCRREEKKSSARMQGKSKERNFCLPLGEQKFLVGTRNYKDVISIPSIESFRIPLRTTLQFHKDQRP